jgi:predicted DNA binding CopG/RHH family protein/uncharacterized coiled-coil protein SlyX
MKCKVPRMTTDREAKAFLAEDLSDLDFSQFKPVRFEFESKSGQLNMRLPQALLDAIKKRAAARGIPYTKFIRQVLEADLSTEMDVPRSRTGRRAAVGTRSRSSNYVASIVREAEKLPAHLQDVVLATVEILAASPGEVRDRFHSAFLRIGTAIEHDQTEIRKVSQKVADITNKLEDMAQQKEDAARQNRDLNGRVDGLAATVANLGNQNKQLQDRLRVLYESDRRDVAARAQGALAVSGERH